MMTVKKIRSLIVLLLISFLSTTACSGMGMGQTGGVILGNTAVANEDIPWDEDTTAYIEDTGIPYFDDEGGISIDDGYSVDIDDESLGTGPGVNGATDEYDTEDPDSHLDDGTQDGPVSIVVTPPKEDDECDVDQQGQFLMVMSTYDDDHTEVASNSSYLVKKSSPTPKESIARPYLGNIGKTLSQDSVLQDDDEDGEGEVYQCEVDRDDEDNYTWQKMRNPNLLNQIQIAVLFEDNNNKEVDFIDIKRSGSFRIPKSLLELRGAGEKISISLSEKKTKTVFTAGKIRITR